MSFGVTSSGFKLKRLEDVQQETKDSIEAKFGAGFDQSANTPEGQLKGLLDESIALIWEAFQAVYLSRYPASAEGAALDNVLDLTGNKRKNAIRSTVDSGRARGSFGTVIPSGTIISVSGNPNARFVTDQSATISIAAINEIQNLGMGGEADGGDLDLEFDGETTGNISAPFVAGDIESALEGLANVGAGNVSVAGVAPVNEVQTIGFDNDPDGGSFELVFTEGTTAPINHNDSLATVKSKIEAVLGTDTIVVTGAIDNATGLTLTYKGTLGGIDRPLPTVSNDTLNFSATPSNATPAASVDGAAGTFQITFIAALGGLNQPLITVNANTLTFDSTAVVVTPSVDTEGDKAKTPPINMTAEDTGPTVANAGSLTVIETAVPGMDEFTNDDDAILGQDLESDEDARIRREQELQIAGAATVDAIKAGLDALDSVTAVIVFENDSSSEDVEGRPPHSLDIVVQGGDEDDIAEEILARKAGGITLIGDIVKIVKDSQGFDKTIKFSRPTDVDILLEIDLTVDSLKFPVDGVTQVRDKAVAFGNDQFQIGDDVVIFGSNGLSCSFIDVPGILDYVIRISKKPTAPTTDDNIPITAREIANFDTSDTTVVVV